MAAYRTDGSNLHNCFPPSLLRRSAIGIEAHGAETRRASVHESQARSDRPAPEIYCTSVDLPPINGSNPRILRPPLRSPGAREESEDDEDDHLPVVRPR